MEEKKEILIAFKPSNKVTKAQAGINLITAAKNVDIILPVVCGRKAKCGKCKIKILQEQIPYTRDEEMMLTSQEISNGIHLACQINVDKDLEVEILSVEYPEKIRLLTYGRQVHYDIDDHLKKRYVELKPPKLDNPLDDLFNLETNLLQDHKELHLPLSLLQNLSTFLRKNDFKATFVLSNGQIVNIESGDTTPRSFGLAFDIGTTTVAGTLIDLRSGQDLAVRAKTNPQHIYGADVITRLNFSVNEPGGLGKLQNMIIETINEIIEELIAETDVNFREIYEMSLAGNTIMNHIFLGVNPQYIGESPYIPTFREGQTYTAEELGLTLLPKAQVSILPNISGYIGGDITGFILAYDLNKKDKITLSIDIGTNGEIILGSCNRLLCCSAAAGPAFEGGHISCGMGAIPGAIEKIVFDEENIYFQVIGDIAPKGICGTGLIDLVAEMLKFGIIDQNGKICSADEVKFKWYQDRIIENEKGANFIIIPAQQMVNNEPLVITQKDVRQLQLAKAAIYAAIKILMRELSISEKEIEEILIAGAFGSYINKFNAQLIGLIPNITPEKVHFVGNAASIGAKKFLLSESGREQAKQIINFAQYIELSMREDFQNEFAEAMFFKILN